MLSLSITKWSFLQTPARLASASPLNSEAQKGLSLYVEGAAHVYSVHYSESQLRKNSCSREEMLWSRWRLSMVGGPVIDQRDLRKAGHPRKVGLPYTMLNIWVEYSFL